LKVGIVPTYGVSLSLGSPEVLDQTTYTYPFQIKNTGNADDSFNLTLSQSVIDALAVQGWDATISGVSTPYKVVSVSAGSTQTVNVVLTANRESPETDISVSASVISTPDGNHSSASADVPLEKGNFSPDAELTVSGNGASMSAPQIPAGTWFLLAMIVLMVVALVILRVNKGVFGRRRKR
jgi:dolichyl-diphosphooligosaccharide--protein glycosyltransferase